MKIVLGDKSDCIEPVFKRCGVKTAEQYYDDNNKFLEALKKENAYDRFDLNKKIISFSEIPLELVNKFIEKYKYILNNL